MEFSQILENLLDDRGITAYRLHKETGIPESLISTWKSGLKKPSFENILVLSKYFDVSADYLLGKLPKEAYENSRKSAQDSSITLNSFTYAMYHESKELSENDKQMLLQMARMLKERAEKDKK